ncbi:hypothetical protein VFPPC_18149 [Pochonia chlamydosporia 170]|uniref:Uncharacterized protein n=1 Tax=Pochonia chlamydosporia 170 TaxID=1380566 RepID=A0A219API7_METCM|nr:hypothetical protein VFPPC_18149 [Pochonia chlamydosporia 170]OWT42736.1 hypothetical protein VFPPC_18149 [Pochonia chlamydosporia 170]
MWFAKLPQAHHSLRLGVKKLMPAAYLQTATAPAQPFSMSRSIAWPKKNSPQTVASSPIHKPQPTESEEDVTADRSPVDPLHSPKSVNSKSKPAATGNFKASGGNRKQTTKFN